MKKILFINLAIVFSIGISTTYSQTTSSVNNGNWNNPLTWACTCIPTPGYTVSINHTITLTNDFAYTSGSITVNNSGKLQDDVSGRKLWVSGTGFFINNGAVDLKTLLYSGNGGAFQNNGALYLSSLMNTSNFVNSGSVFKLDSMYNNGTFINNVNMDVTTFLNTLTMTNNGTILNVDSMVNAGTFTNSSSGVLSSDSCTNTGTFINEGSVSYNQFTNTGTFTNNNYLTFSDFTNSGEFNNSDTLMGLNSFWNIGIFNNLSTGFYKINNDFFNVDFVNHDAVFSNEGRVDVLDSWYNVDTVKGITGKFTVADTSSNIGFMKGSFSFCDNTPPLNAPFVDINLGTISNNINWCITGIKENKSSSTFFVNPNFVSNQITIENTISQNIIFSIYTIAGERIIVEKIEANKNIILNLSFLQTGFYLYRIVDSGGSILGYGKMVKE